MKIKLLAVLAVLAMAASGCTRPKYLVRNGFIEGRNSKYILEPAASGESVSLGNKQGNVALYDFSVRVCDYSGDAETNCNTSLIMQNVWPGSVY